MSTASVFERTWEAAIELCRKGEVAGRAYVAGTTLSMGGMLQPTGPITYDRDHLDKAVDRSTADARSAVDADDRTLDDMATVSRAWAVLDRQGQVVFLPPEKEEQSAISLFAVARRFAELEHAFDSGEEVPPYIDEPRRTPQDSLREWGLMDEQGTILSAYESDPEPLLGYVVRVGNVYAYGVVKQSILNAGTITPTGACESADEARRRASELLMLALVRGATVMGMNGVPAVIDLSAETQET